MFKFFMPQDDTQDNTTDQKPKKPIPTEPAVANENGTQTAEPLQSKLPPEIASTASERGRLQSRAISGTGGGDASPYNDLEEAKKEIDKLTDIAKRALADLENYRRRVDQERAQFIQFSNATLILAILPVLDNFHRAADHLPEDLKKNDWVNGIMQIEKQFDDVLKKIGLTEIDCVIGSHLDTMLYEAVLTAPGAQDSILQELEKGYMLGEKVLRPAKVKVGDGSKE